MIPLSSVVTRQIPEFVREDYPGFVEFIKAYYDFLDTQSIGTITSLTDIDTTIDSFFKYFRDQLDVNGVEYPYIDKKLFLRNSKDLFSAKGSPESFQFLFRILFGLESTVITPWDYALIPSNGKWHEDISLFVSTTKGSAANLTSTYITITGTDGDKYLAFVTNVNKYSEGVYQIYIERIDRTYIKPDCTFTNPDGSIKGTLLRTTQRVQVDAGGSGFVVGQLFRITGFSGSGTIVKVKSINSKGSITAMEIIEFGVGYNTDFTVKIYPENAILGDKTSTINLVETGTDSLNATYDTTDVLHNPTEAITFVKHNYTATAGNPDEYLIDTTYVGEIVGEVVSQDNEAIAKVIINGAIIRIILGAWAIYPGYYLDGESILDDLDYIQDSSYYQKYSYVTALEQPIDNYRTIVKDTLHPLGTALFGNYQIVNNFNISLTVDPQLNIIIQSTPIQESVKATDNVTLGANKYITDTVTTTNRGYAVGAPYTDVLPDPFWDITYLENEQPISN